MEEYTVVIARGRTRSLLLVDRLSLLLEVLEVDPLG